MDHNEIGDLLAAYLDDEVTPEERARIDGHLAGCRDCRRELESLKSAQTALRDALRSRASGIAPPSTAWSDLQHELGVQRPSFLFLFRRRRWRVVATIVAVAILVTLSVLWLTGVLPGLR
jgi:anti-sigma factor RsiW